jgi:spore germination cell wall hydrolase CwlJ-like protein
MNKMALALMIIITAPSVFATEQLGMSPSELECMGLTVYGEARGESKFGQLLVMDVIYNRKKSVSYPNHLCDVIKQHRQFSFWKGEYKSPRDKRSYSKIKKLVNEYELGVWRGIARDSMWYHADHINPRWASKLEMVWHIDNHIFYR